MNRFYGGVRAVAGRLGETVIGRAQSGLARVERLETALRDGRRTLAGTNVIEPTQGAAFVGTVWQGGDSVPTPGCVIVDSSGRIAQVHLGERPELPTAILALGGVNHWVVPGIVDAHVHLSFDALAVSRQRPSGFATGLVGVRDLGSPPRLAYGWQTGHRRRPPVETPFVAVAGPVLTAPGGYPSQGWGADCSQFVTSTDQARSVVRQLASDGVDLIKVALESLDGTAAVIEPKILLAIVESAHRLGLPVIAHALTDDMVRRALDSEVDELAHIPTGRLSDRTIGRMADAGMSVTSTLQTFFSAGLGPEAAANGIDLVAAGVRIRYGTDLGNAGTRTGVDPRELDRIADLGLGRLGALRAATQYAATAPGMKGLTGRLVAGDRAALVLLSTSPIDEPGVWRTPSAVFSDGRLTVGAVNPTRASADR